MRGRLIALGLALATVLSAGSPGAAQPMDALTLSPENSEEAGFAAWLANYRLEAMRQGVRPETLDSQLAGLTYSRRVVSLDRAQPDDSHRTSPPRFADYLAQRLNDARAARGRALRSDLAATLSGIEARYGVPPAIMLAIWGMETGYGSNSGDFDLIRALATLAYDGRRGELFTRELTAALLLLDRNMVTRDRLIGSWAGATGQVQFLPSSVAAYAVDGNGDGRVDIWHTQADALASIANYLTQHGWQRGQPWSQRVFVPPTLDRERLRDLVAPTQCPGVLRRHSRWIPIREWKALGVVPIDGKGWPSDDTLATLVEPDGPGNGGYLTYGNYRAILGYNCSNFYALSVGLLADAVG